MDWCRLQTNYYLDGALLRAGEAAEVLFLRCIAYSGAEETRGRIPRHILPMLTPTKTQARVAALVGENLLIDEGDHLVIRSWARIQEALDAESERRRKDRERKAAARAAQKSNGLSTDTSADCPQTVQVESARIEVEEEEEKKTSSSSGRGKRGTAVPDIFPITDAMRAWGRENAPLVTDPEAETRQFLDHHRAKGSTFKDWTAAWRTWMSNAQKYARQRGGKPAKRYEPGFEWLENM